MQAGAGAGDADAAGGDEDGGESDDPGWRNQIAQLASHDFIYMTSYIIS